MTKAQIVRNNRFNAIQSALNGEMEKVFDWILDAIEKRTEKNNFDDLELYIDGNVHLRPVNDTKGEEDYDISDLILSYGKETVCATLKKVVEKEEGYKVSIKNTIVWDSKSTLIVVRVE